MGLAWPDFTRCQGGKEPQSCSSVCGHDPRKLRPSSHSDLCDLTLLKPLWQLFTQMEYSLFEDVTQAGILLPLHRALTELFFVTENRAQVRVCASAPRQEPWGVTGVPAELRREMGLAWGPGFPSAPPQGAGSALRLSVCSGLMPKRETALDSNEFGKTNRQAVSSSFLPRLSTIDSLTRRAERAFQSSLAYPLGL